MTAIELAPDELSALESRAEVDALGDLHARRRAIMRNLAPLKALYGSFGLWDARRKQLIEAYKVKARMRLTTPDGKKPTETQIDAEAHADPEYERFLDNSLSARIDFLNMETELAEIEERVRSRELALMAYSAELRLAR